MRPPAVWRRLRGTTTQGSDRIPDEELRRALDETLLRALRPIATLLAVLELPLLVLVPWSNPDHVGFFATQNLLSFGSFAALRVALRSRPPSPGWAHPIAALVVAVLMIGSFNNIVVAGTPLETFPVILLILGVSFFYTSARWFAGALAGTVAAWGLAVWLAPPSDLYSDMGLAMLQGVLLSFMVFVVRVRTLTRVEDLIWRNTHQTLRLERLSGQLAEAQQLAHLGTWEWEIVTDRVTWSQEVHRIFGIEPGTPMTFARFLDCVHPDDKAFVEATIQRAREDRQPWTVEHRIVRPDGEVRVLQGSGRVKVDEGGCADRMLGTALDITERKRAEEALRLQKALLEAEAEASIDGILVVDPQGRILLHNRRFQTMWGIPDEVVRKRSDEAALQSVHDKLADPQEFFAKVRHLYAHPHETSLDGIRLKDGRAFDRYSAPVEAPDGTQYGRVWYFRDATERERAAEALRESEERFRTVFEESPVGVALATTDRRFLKANAAFCHMLERTEEELKLLTTADVTHPDERAEDEARWTQFLRGEIPTYQRQKRYLTKEGRVVWADVAVSLVKGKEGVARYAIGIVEDITPQKQAERRLAAQHAATRALADATREEEAVTKLVEVICAALGWAFGAVWTVDEAANVLRCAGTWRASADKEGPFEEITRGRTFERGIGLPGRVWANGEPAWIEDVTVDTNFPRAPYAAREGLHGAFGFPILIRRKPIGVMEFFSSRIEEPDPELLRMMTSIGSQLGLFIERKRAEEALRQSEERFRLLAQNARDVVYRYRFQDPPGFEYVSPASEPILGYPPEAYYADPNLAFERVHPEDRPLLDAAMLESPHRPLLQRVIRRDGRVVWIEQRGTVLRDEEGNVVAFEGIARDVTALKEAEEQVRAHRDRLEKLTQELQAANKELESFAYTVSHDLKAPLRGIDFYGQALQEDYESKLDEAGRDMLTRLRGEAMRMGHLIEDLLRLSRTTRGELHHEDVDLAALAREVLDELRRRDADRRVDVRIEKPLVANGDPRFLRVVMENLLGNAWKYTSHTAEARIEVGSRATQGGAEFFVRDNGAGFDPAKAGRLFQPFVRLHGKEFPGTGIGLATVQRLIARHGGRIWAQTDGPGKGATFSFTLGAPTSLQGEDQPR